MDLRDIQRMHDQYAQAPITIDVDAAPIAALSASARQAAQTPLFDAMDGNKRLMAMMLLVAAVSLPAGMMLASANKKSTEVTTTLPVDAMPAQPPVGFASDEAIQWPGTKDLPVDETSPATSVPSATSSPAAASAAAQLSAVQAPKKVHASKAIPPETRKSEAAAHTPNHPAPKPAPVAGDVSLF